MQAATANTTVRRYRGIPGSHAAERVAAMGGPVAQRASRRRSTSGPGFIDLERRTAPPVGGDDDEEERPALSQRARRHVDAVSVADDEEDLLETSLDADVTETEDWSTPPVQRATRSISRQRGSEDVAISTMPRRRRTQRKEMEPLPQARRESHWLLPLGAGMLLIIVLYTVVFWVYFLGLGIANRLSYGPHPTSEMRAVLGLSDSQDDPSVILASNIDGRIVVTILPGGEPGRAFIYQLTALSPAQWGNLDDVAPTIEVQPHASTPNIAIRLVGDPDYWHFFARPALTVTLINTGKGFQVLAGPQQGQNSLA